MPYVLGLLTLCDCLKALSTCFLPTCSASLTVLCSPLDPLRVLIVICLSVAEQTVKATWKLPTNCLRKQSSSERASLEQKSADGDYRVALIRSCRTINGLQIALLCSRLDDHLCIRFDLIILLTAPIHSLLLAILSQEGSWRFFFFPPTLLLSTVLFRPVTAPIGHNTWPYCSFGPREYFNVLQLSVLRRWEALSRQ